MKVSNNFAAFQGPSRVARFRLSEQTRNWARSLQSQGTRPPLRPSGDTYLTCQDGWCLPSHVLRFKLGICQDTFLVLSGEQI